MKEKYDVPIASESEFVEYMLSQMAAFGLPCTLQQLSHLDPPLSMSELVLDFLAFPWPSMIEPCT